ncbi:MAG TPA: PAS domain-containing sensor histidine kinase [Rhodospirillaceae bacterium]|nr:PAS domain-containing sensor histidine kinase [Rhodospirillaceae bacterium]
MLTGLAVAVGVVLTAGQCFVHRLEVGRLQDLRRRAEQRLGVALAGSSVVLSEQDLDLRYTWVSGADRAESYIGLGAGDLFDPDSCRRLDAVKRAVIGSGRPHRQQMTLAAPGGPPQIFDSYFAPRRDRRGAVVGVIASSINVTEQVTCLSALRRQEEQLCLAAELGRLGTFEWDLETGAIDLSAETRRIFGLAATGLVLPADLRRHIHPDDREILARETDRARDPAGDGVLAAKIRVVTADGRLRCLEMRARTIFTPTPGVRACRQIGAVQDVTGTILAEQALRAAEAEALAAQSSKARFMAAASHDLRQPLQALNLYFAVLAARISAAEAMVMARIEDCVGRLNDLLGHMVDLNKLDAGVIVPKPRSLVLMPLMRRVAANFAAAASAKGIAIRVAPSLATGWTDPVLLERILANLMSNAVRYTAKGGILIGCRRRGGRLWVEVHDTGIGIPDDKIGEIFEEFKQIGNDERNPENGRGLGLAIVRRIAALLGVEIRVWSRLGQGSVFAVEVPSESDPRSRPRPLSYRPADTTIVG